ncbi:MAG: 2-oxo acid dehydrogenase subunit E2 [Bacilli bacterium]|nr:2-oxo acid dehydrogenase subunit E2 [Bacilli bacterium]
MRSKYARRVKDFNGMNQIAIDLKPQRCVSDVYINMKMDMTNVIDYLDKKKKEGEHITLFHAIVTAVGMVFYNRPYLNRFVQDRHIFEHKYVDISFVAKVAFNDTAEEMMIIIRVDEDDNLETISKKIYDKVHGVRDKDKKVEKKGANGIIDVLAGLPNPIRIPIVGLLKWMDRKGCLPDSICQDNLYYSSIILSNLGTLGSNAIFHNITDFGNSSGLATIGEVRDEEVLIDGKKEIRKRCEFGINLDERIADGYYFVRSVQLLQYIFDHPELLEQPANTKIEVEKK